MFPKLPPQLLAAYLEKTFPEIEKACNVRGFGERETTWQNQSLLFNYLMADKHFLDFFDIPLISGSYSFLTPGRNEIGMADDLAKKMFGDKDPVGEKIEVFKEEYTITGVVRCFKSHSNLSPGIIIADPEQQNTNWYGSSHHTFIRLKKQVDIRQFADKLEELEIKEEGMIIRNFFITPITSIRYVYPVHNLKVKFHHLILFTVACSLVLLCAILNYLTLFVSRLNIRGKEFALQKTNGASYGDLLRLFIVEFGMTLSLSIFCGLLLSELFLPSFKELAGIKSANNYIYLETGLFSLGISLVILFLSSFYIHYLNKRTINAVFRGSSAKKGNLHSQKIFITLQLIIAILFIFCTSVSIKQIHLLTQSDRIIERTGRATLRAYNKLDALVEIARSNPYITEVLPVRYSTFLPQSGTTHYRANQWDEQQEQQNPFMLEKINGDEQFCSYFGLKLVKGSFFKEENKNHVLINEAACKEFGWDEPVGKTFITGGNQKMTVAGVVRDFCRTVPTVPIKPLFITGEKEYDSTDIMFIYQEGLWKECRNFMEEQIRKLHPDVLFTLNNAEEVYNKDLESENALVLLLDIVSIICIFISMFGVYSIVSLDCINRRKEMAIRKINGAGAGRITWYFLKRYLFLLLIAAVIAFPVGYYAIQSWLQDYILQTSISGWYYTGILVTLTGMICLCISSSIIKIIKSNPVESIRKD